MFKLYRCEDGKPVAYHEAWLSGSKVVEHWGRLGEPGQTRQHRADSRLGEQENIERVLQPALADGFEPIDLDRHATLLIEYPVDGMGARADLDKRHALEDRMDEVLGWTGLGVCDGGSIGSGTMDVCCFVVDFDTAKRIIAEDLAGTRFADYTRIYNREAG